jgi:hypothetical protein
MEEGRAAPMRPLAIGDLVTYVEDGVSRNALVIGRHGETIVDLVIAIDAPWADHGDQLNFGPAAVTIRERVQLDETGRGLVGWHMPVRPFLNEGALMATAAPVFTSAEGTGAPPAGGTEQISEDPGAPWSENQP